MLLKISWNSQKTPVPEPFLNKEGCNFIKKETLTVVFSCIFCESSKITLFTNHIRTIVSETHMKPRAFLNKVASLGICERVVLYTFEWHYIILVSLIYLWHLLEKKISFSMIRNGLMFKVSNRNTRNMWNMFKVYNKNTRTTTLTSFWCFYC